MSGCVSVIMPIYNCERFIQQAIESILAQTLTDFELILINDASTDQTAEIALSYTDQRIRYVENERNLGVSASLNRGIEQARSDLIARMDGDDISQPERLMIQYRFLQDHIQVGAAGSAVEIIDEDNRPLRIWRFPSDPVLCQWQMIFTNPMAHPSVMMRKSLVQAVGGYRSFKAEDIDLWERLSQVSQLTNLPQVLLKLRKHPTSITQEKKAELIDSASLVSQRLIKRMIHQNIALDLVAKMYGDRLEYPSDSVAIADLIAHLNRCFQVLPDISPAVQQDIRRDAARKVFRLIRREQVHISQAWHILRRALALDPLVLIRIFASKIPKGIPGER